MSEYQYYEFMAIDRPLTRAEMAELRAVSTRAVITSTGFTNHYEWGDLKADPVDWMRRYFDAFVYSANWSNRRLSLRLPKVVFRKAELMPFANRSTLSVESGSTHWVLAWTLDESELEESEETDHFDGDDGSGWMRRLIPLRDELLRGDLRPLYLGWLAGVHALNADILEPEVPPGLTELSPAQQALVDFLRVDPDLLTAARKGSATTSSPGIGEDQEINAWVGTWQADEMRNVLKHIALGQGQEAERQVKSRYAAWLKARLLSSCPTSPSRSVAELHELAQSAAAVRRKHEAKERAKQEAERRQQRETSLLPTDGHGGQPLEDRRYAGQARQCFRLRARDAHPRRTVRRLHARFQPQNIRRRPAALSRPPCQARSTVAPAGRSRPVVGVRTAMDRRRNDHAPFEIASI
jgi:hypothetical protein